MEGKYDNFVFYEYFVLDSQFWCQYSLCFLEIFFYLERRWLRVEVYNIKRLLILILNKISYGDMGEGSYIENSFFNACLAWKVFDCKLCSLVNIEINKSGDNTILNKKSKKEIIRIHYRKYILSKTKTNKTLNQSKIKLRTRTV